MIECGMISIFPKKLTQTFSFLPACSSNPKAWGNGESELSSELASTYVCMILCTLYSALYSTVLYVHTIYMHTTVLD